MIKIEVYGCDKDFFEEFSKAIRGAFYFLHPGAKTFIEIKNVKSFSTHLEKEKFTLWLESDDEFEMRGMKRVTELLGFEGF